MELESVRFKLFSRMVVFLHYLVKLLLLIINVSGSNLKVPVGKSQNKMFRFTLESHFILDKP